jgi:3',5'-cyclic AMP phosphodiesterase CpdA
MPAPTVAAPSDEQFLRAANRGHTQLTSAAEGEWTDDWFFMQMADTQLGMLNFQDDAENWEVESEMLRLAIRHINRLKPKFVVVCGDLVNAMPSEDSLQTKQVDSFKHIMSEVSDAIPLVCICGNHDVGNEPDRATVSQYRDRFGDDYLAFWAGGCRCLVLNSSLYSALEPGRYPADQQRQCREAGVLQAEQASWLEREVSELEADLEKSKFTMVFSHIPPFIQAHDEGKGYFNLHPSVRDPLLQSLRRCHARAWFCGHFHRNAGGWDRDGELEVVITTAVGTTLPYSAAAQTGDEEGAITSLGLDGFAWDERRCSVDSSGLRIVCVAAEHGVQHRFFTLAAVPAAVSPSEDAAAWAAEAGGGGAEQAELEKKKKAKAKAEA